jgi:hypothetical protein
LLLSYYRLPRRYKARSQVRSSLSMFPLIPPLWKVYCMHHPNMQLHQFRHSGLLLGGKASSINSASLDYFLGEKPWICRSSCIRRTCQDYGQERSNKGLNILYRI